MIVFSEKKTSRIGGGGSRGGGEVELEERKKERKKLTFHFHLGSCKGPGDQKLFLEGFLSEERVQCERE